MTKYDPQKHHRCSIRLKGYDYTQAGSYFVTFVTYQRELLFGQVADGNMVLNEMGKIADKFWRAIPDHFPFVGLGAYVVMPNHVHGIIVIHETVGASGKRPNGPKPGSLGAIIGAYKMAVTRRIKEEHNATGIWQRNYYERVIRNEREMENIWRYIEANPAMWRDDTENPARIGPR